MTPLLDSHVSDGDCCQTQMLRDGLVSQYSTCTHGTEVYKNLRHSNPDKVNSDMMRRNIQLDTQDRRPASSRALHHAAK